MYILRWIIQSYSILYVIVFFKKYFELDVSGEHAPYTGVTSTQEAKRPKHY